MPFMSSIQYRIKQSLLPDNINKKLIKHLTPRLKTNHSFSATLTLNPNSQIKRSLQKIL